MILLVIRYIKHFGEWLLCNKRERVSRPHGLGLLYLHLKRRCQMIVSSHSIAGKVIVSFFTSVAFFQFFPSFFSLGQCFS